MTGAMGDHEMTDTEPGSDPGSARAAIRLGFDSYPPGGGAVDQFLRDRRAGALRDRADALMGPAVAKAWWDGANDFLEGARPADLLALGRFEDVAAALDAAEQKVWGG